MFAAALALAGRGAPDPLAFVGFWNWEFDPERQAPPNSSSIAVFWFVVTPVMPANDSIRCRR